MKVIINNTSVYFGAFYLPPDLRTDFGVLNSHVASVEKVCSQLKETDLLFLCGDYNLPSVDWRISSSNDGYLVPFSFSSCQSISSSAAHLIDNFDLQCLSQLNSVRNHQGRILDLVLANDIGQAATLLERAVHPLLDEDRYHPALESMINIRTKENITDAFDANSLNFNKVDYVSLSNLLLATDWTPITSCNTVDDAVQLYENTVNELLPRVAPTDGPKPSPPWSTPRLLKLKRRRNADQRRYRQGRTPINRRAYFIASDSYRRENDRLYKIYIRRSENNLRRNPKSFWKFVNSKRKDNGLPLSMFLDDRVASTTPDICNLFAERFASVFVDEYLSDDEVHSATQDVPADVCCSSGFIVTDSDIINASKKLKSSVSPGPDGIPTCILVKCAHLLLEPLRHIFNLSLTTGSFPSQWKRSYMFPVFKKGDRRDASNYRGITSLCSSSKLMEILVSNFLMSKFKTYISCDQHGFFPGRSVTTNLLDFTSFVTRQMEKRLQVDAVYTDLKAAFDCLNHTVLIAKLKKLGLHGSILSWFHSYLIKRTLNVKVGAAISNPLNITSGVPQGSNLGPLLFSIFFNDISRSLEPQSRLFYADDLKIYSVIRRPEDTSNLQRMLDIFQHWCNRNRMTLSINKCSVISFTYKKNPVIVDYSLNNTTLLRVQQICDLGVILDTKLTFNDHMTSTISRANRQLGFIVRVCKSFSDPYCFRALYFSLVRSILEFSSIVWSPSYSCWSDRIEAVQRRFLRYALSSLPWRDPSNLPPYEQRCKLINVETLSCRREKSSTVFVAKVLLGDIDSPAILRNLNFHVPSRQLRAAVFFSLPFRRTNYGQNEPLRRLCETFNKYSNLFDFNISLECFKNRLNAYSVR